MAERATVFGKAYPFHFPGPVVGQKIAVVPKILRTDKQQLYLALLLNCGQRHVDKSTQTKLGHLFEMGCEPLFGKVVPSCTTKALFGAGAEVENPVFSGNLKERITSLAIKLKVHP